MIELYNRTVRIGGNGVGFRDIFIQEMTESEIESIKFGRWIFAAYGMLSGLLLSLLAMWWVWQPYVEKYCR